MNKNENLKHLDAYQDRREAALNFIANRGTSSEEVLLSSYKKSQVDYVKARKEATDYVRLINDDNNFNDINYIFPVFILQNMPIGVIGMIMAAIMAAAMSSVSSELNSLATTSTMDIYRQHINPKGNDEDLLRFGKIATFLWGIFVLGCYHYLT